MHLWWFAGALLAVVAILLLTRSWILPWRDLEDLLAAINRGRQPATFLLTGSRRPRRVGLLLEQLLMRQKALERQLSQDAAQMHAVFAALADGLLVIDAARSVRICNPAFERIYGRRFLSPGTPLLDVVRDADVLEAIRRSIDSASVESAEIVAPDGKTRLQLTALPILKEEQRLDGVVVLFHDITPLKQADQIRRDFVANVSHELRTPLSIFRGNLETLLEGTDLGPGETRHIYGVMQRHSDRLTLLVNDLLTLARLESDELGLDLDWIELPEFLRGIAADWANRCAQKDLELIVNAAATLPKIRADELRLEEIVHNLLDNAVRYSPVGDSITISVFADDAEFRLSVTDRGVGIPAPDLPRIFERFYRVDPARQRELGGTGLGLSIVKHIAQLHGGRVEAESQIGEGTTVSVVLPVAGPKPSPSCR